MAKKKILVLNHVSEVGGAECSLLDMVRSLDAETYEVVVVLPSPGSLASRLEELGARVVYLPFQRLKRTLNPLVLFGYLLTVLGAARRLVKLVAREEPDVVHANSNTAHVYTTLAARFLSVPVVWHSRDLVDLGVVGRFMCRAADRIVAISGAVASSLQRYVEDDSKLVVIHNGVSLQNADADAVGGIRRELCLAPVTHLTAMIGQMVPWKNHRLFLESASLILEKLPGSHFLIVGSDLFHDHLGYRMEIEGCVESLGLRDRVTFTGYREDIARILSGVNVLIHPTDREPFGRVIVEAMALGKPVVAINACGPAEIISDGTDGVLVAPDSPGDIAAAVIRLAGDADLAESIGRAAAEKAAADFSLDKFGGRLDSLYSELTGRP